MREREPVIQTMKASQARQEFSQLLNKVFRRETRVIVEKSGIPVAAIISTEDLERLQQLEEQRQRNFDAIEAVGAAFKDVPDEELEAEVARAVEEARAGQPPGRDYPQPPPLPGDPG
jgi:prevent-host-death family protein